MSIINKIFSGGANKLVESVGGVLDNLTTTKEEKILAKQKLKELILNHEAEMQQNAADEELRANPNPVPTGPCPYCGQVKPYVLGEDDEGIFVIQSCQDCLPETDLAELNVEEIIESLDPVLTDEQLLQLSEIEFADEEEGEGWIETDESMLQEIFGTENVEDFRDLLEYSGGIDSEE